MLCGVELLTVISEEKVNWLSKRFNLDVKKQFNAKHEKLIHERPNSYRRNGKYRNIVIEVSRSADEYSLTLRGSLHKFYHGNNKGAFYGYEILKAIQELCNTFCVDPFHARILNLEIGLNIPTWFTVFPYLKSNLLYHKKVTPQEITSSSRLGFQFKHEDYLLKFYCKDRNLLRYEVKHTSIKTLAKFGLSFLNDITEATVDDLADDCLKQFQELVMADELNIYKEVDRDDSLTYDDRKCLLEFTSQLFISSYSETLKSVSEAKKAAMRQRNYRLKKKCIHLIKKYGNQDKDKLFELMCSQVEVFIDSWSDPALMINKENVTNSAIDKERENVTNRISILTITDNNKIKINMNNTVKSKKQINREKREEEKMKMNRFYSSLELTLKKIEREAA